MRHDPEFHLPPPPPPLTSIPTPKIPPPPPRGLGNTIPRRGQSLSLLRQVAARLDPVTSDRSRRIPSRTFIKGPLAGDILEFPTHKHPRVDLELELAVRLFVGGRSIEGTAQISTDDADRVRYKRTLSIVRIPVDPIGLEEMTGSKKSVFLNLATELIGSENPPPYNMVESQDQISLDDSFCALSYEFSVHSKFATGCRSSTISVKACENSTCALYHSPHPGSGKAIYRGGVGRYSRLTCVRP